MSKVKYTITNESVSIVLGGKPYTVQKGATNYEGLRKAVLTEQWDLVPKYVTVAKGIEEWAKGNFQVGGANQIFYKGIPIPDAIRDRIMKMVADVEDPTPLFNFYEKLAKNPSHRSVQQLFGFLQHCGIPLAPDGDILAYKSVRPDYKDHHSGTFDNHPGVTNRMDRNQVSDDPAVPCHVGLHVGALSYASSFGGSDRLILIVKVNPEHVVSVPNDCSQQKMRVCEYTVVGHHNGAPMPDTVLANDPTVTGKDEECDGTNCDGCAGCCAGDECLGCQECGPGGCGGAGCEGCDDCIDSKEDKKEVDEEEFDVPRKYRRVHNLDQVDLADEDMDVLRGYAANVLKIVGASKIPGGKQALIQRIVQIRGR